MATWRREHGINVDGFIHSTKVQDGEGVTKLWGSDDALYTHLFVEGSTCWRLIVDQEFRPIKVLLYLDDVNVQVTDPCGDELQALVTKVKEIGLPSSHESIEQEFEPEAEEVTCHICGAKAMMHRTVEDPREESWLGEGCGVRHIGWIPWVIDKGFKNANVCPQCANKVEINEDSLYEVM